MSNRRSQILIDPKLQGGLIVRVLTYWCLFLITLSFMVMCWAAYTASGQPAAIIIRERLTSLVPAYISSFVIVPLICVDVIRFSNRFCGPARTIKRSLKSLSTNGTAKPARVRKNDYWQDICDEFNAVAEKFGTEEPSNVETNNVEAGQAAEPQPETVGV